MPVIREYKSQVNEPGPVQGPNYTPDMLGAQSARALGDLGKTMMGVGDLVATRIEQENVSDITAKTAKANAELAVDLQETIRTAEPGDKKVFEDYNQKVDDTLARIAEEASTPAARRYFDSTSAAIKGQLYKTSAQGQAELAGLKAVQDYEVSRNSYTAATLADPSSIALQMQMHSDSIDNLVATGQLPRAEAIKLKAQGEQTISKSAVRGWIGLNPDYAKEKLKSGEFDSTLGADLKAQLYSEADQAIRAKEIEAERKRQEQKRILGEQQAKTQNDFLKAIQENKLDSKTILNSNLEAFGSGSKEQFLQMLKIQNSSEGRLKTDASVMINLYDRIHLPDGDPRKLIDENELNQYFGRGLSLGDLNNLREEMQGRKTQEGQAVSSMKQGLLSIAKGRLTKSDPLTGIVDPEGDEQLLKYTTLFYKEYREGRKKGKSDLELLDPNSPDYLGKHIANFAKTPQQSMKAQLRRARGQKPPEAGKIRVSNGVNVYDVDPADLEEAKRSGYKEVSE